MPRSATPLTVLPGCCYCRTPAQALYSASPYFCVNRSSTYCTKWDLSRRFPVLPRTGGFAQGADASLFLGGGLRRGLRHLVQFGANALVGVAEKAVLAAEVPPDDAPCVDENHVRDSQHAVRVVVPLQAFLHGDRGCGAGGEIRFQRLEEHRIVEVHSLFKRALHYLHIPCRVIFLDRL